MATTMILTGEGIYDKRFKPIYVKGAIYGLRYFIINPRSATEITVNPSTTISAVDGILVTDKFKINNQTLYTVVVAGIGSYFFDEENYKKLIANGYTTIN